VQEQIRDSSVVWRWATGWMIGGSIPGRSCEVFSSPPRPERVWGPLSLQFNGHQGLCLWGWSGRCVNLTTHLHLVPRSRMGGAIHPLSHYAFMAWYLVNHRDTFTFTFYTKSWTTGLRIPVRAWIFLFATVLSTLIYNVHRVLKSKRRHITHRVH
jgi:hypothetical protein